MSQNSVTLPTTGTFSGLTEQGYINNALDTLRTNFSGPTAPGTPSTYQWWFDTTANQLKIYSGSVWAIVASFAAGVWTPYSGGAAIAAAAGSSIAVLSGNYEVKRPRRATTTTSESVLDADRNKHVTFNNAAAVAVTSTAPSGSNFVDGWCARLENLGVGVVTWTPTTATINGGTALKLRQNEWAEVTADGTNFRAITTGQTVFAAGTAPINREVGTRDAIPNVQNANYTFALDDRGGSVYHSDATPRTWTIPAQSSVNFPLGSVILLINDNGAGALTIAITTDTLRRGDGTAGTGSRTVAADSVACLTKIASGVWMITGKFT